MTKGEQDTEKLLKAGVELLKEHGKPVTAKEVGERAGVQSAYVSAYFKGGAAGFWEQVIALVEAERNALFANSDEIYELDALWRSECDAPPKLKTVEYRAKGRKEAGRVFYCFFGKRCVFSAIVPTDIPGNTINSAEAVIAAILGQEEAINLTNFFEYSFYDLETHQGYEGHLPGTYFLNRLELGTGIEGHIIGVAGWKEEHCPEIVFEMFQDFHGARRRYTASELLRLRSKTYPITMTEAAYIGSIETIELLEGNGWSINSTEPDGTSVLDAAIMGRHDEVIEYLKGRGAKLGVELIRSA